MTSIPFLLCRDLFLSHLVIMESSQCMLLYLHCASFALGTFLHSGGVWKPRSLQIISHLMSRHLVSSSKHGRPILLPHELLKTRHRTLNPSLQFIRGIVGQSEPARNVQQCCQERRANLSPLSRGQGCIKED
jgi:hypothetical protein